MMEVVPVSAGSGKIYELLPINRKAIAWLKKHYVEFKEPGINLADDGSSPPTELAATFSSMEDLDPSIKEELTEVTSFLEFVVTVQMHEVLGTKVKELSQDYWYSTYYDQEAGELVTVGSLKRFLVNFGEAGECWRMLGFQLTNQEAEDVIRLLENFEDDTDLTTRWLLTKSPSSWVINIHKSLGEFAKRFICDIQVILKLPGVWYSGLDYPVV